VTKTTRNTPPRRQIPRCLLGKPGLIQEILLIPTPTSPQVIPVLEVPINLPSLVLPVVLHPALHYIPGCKHPLGPRNILQLLPLVPQHRATPNKPSRPLVHLLPHTLVLLPQRKPHSLPPPTHRRSTPRQRLRRGPASLYPPVKRRRSTNRRRT